MVESDKAGLTLETEYKNKEIGFHPKSLQLFLRILCVVDDSIYACSRNFSCAPLGHLRWPRLIKSSFFSYKQIDQHDKTWFRLNIEIYLFSTQYSTIFRLQYWIRQPRFFKGLVSFQIYYFIHAGICRLDVYKYYTVYSFLY